MTNPIPDVPDETLNPNTAEQCREKEGEEEAPPPTPHSDPQSPKALQNHQITNLPDPDSTNPNQDKDTLMEDQTQLHNTDDPEPDALPAAAAVRRAPKRKKLDPKRTAQEKKAREKLQVLVETLKPVLFVPSKVLDFESHKSLLQRLGLWDFVHLEFDPTIRADLVAQLIAGYVPSSHGSYVNGVRIGVNRSVLCRYLKLPMTVKKKNSPAASVGEGGEEALDSRESIAFVDELVSNWMLLHDDTYIMPDEVSKQLKLIKEGNLEMVDWLGLVWSMMEKELKSPQLENCYYASHFQHLIKTQRKELLEEAPEAEREEEVEAKGEGEEVEAKDEGEEVEAKDEEEEGEEEEEEDAVGDEVDGSGDVKMGGVDESRVRELEEHNIELSLGQDNNVERVQVEKEQSGGEEAMDFEQSKEEEQGMWLLDQKCGVGEPFLRPCPNSDVKGMDCGQVKEDEEGEDGQEQEEEEEEAEEDEHEGGFHLSPKCIPLEGMPSGTGGLIQAMEAAQMPFGSGIDLRDNPVGDFLSSRDDPQMISGSSLFGNGHKRDIDLDNHNSHHSLNGGNKRLRSDSPWNSKPADFETCMEQMEHWLGKARMFYATKDQACEEATMNQQLLINELQKRDSVIDHLHKARMEESQKRQMEVYRLEKELYAMQSLVEGYRKALKESQKSFAEYRARCPQADEPLYKDVPGSGGLVLSVMELEKERLKKEEEERIKLREFFRDFEKKCRDIEGTWMGPMSILEGHLSKVESLGDRLQALEDKVKHFKEVNAKCMISDPLECAPLSEGQTA